MLKRRSRYDIQIVTFKRQKKLVSAPLFVDTIYSPLLLQISKNMNDIALIKLSSSVQWSQHVQPICLPDSEAENFAGKHGLLAGWGFDMERESRFQELLCQSVNVIVALFFSLKCCKVN